MEDLPLPWQPGAHEPFLTTFDGALYMSWMEQAGDRTRVMMAVRTLQGWSDPRLVQEGTDLFVNWADFPGIAVLKDGTVAVHWLREIGLSSYDYRIEIAVSHDGGASWSDPIVPHDDRSFSQHGFVSMLPTQPNDLAVIWLDGRAYAAKAGATPSAPGAMQLRATSLTRDGVPDRDVAVDPQTCSCCQTSLAASGDGTIIAAYRDRTEGEIRDIAVARLTKQGWQTPVMVHDDGWELSGCPVNGPAVSALQDRVVTTWFTGANDVPAVKVAFSEDGGRTFGEPDRIDLGSPVGRVDVEMLDDGSAIVSWVEWSADGESLVLCRARAGLGCVASQVLAVNADGASVNFPKMARSGNDVFVAWTQPIDGGDTIKLRRGVLPSNQ
ncbi:hypothetical protein MAA8898_04428 [Maliponia aquimaris]|uniref:BNR/Asp-box repeat protein n=2 Tax=Maliponia aquimaris TaxID=1673631 RepID=A0A238L414_9RHOB|nr:hypothetical protein MAA8898_04428 [Maliponia aquimaris]